MGPVLPVPDPPYRQVRALFDDETVTVYQAYSSSIAGPAVEAQTFVAPFKTDRMSWIKPSFLWMMYRSGRATTAHKEYDHRYANGMTLTTIKVSPEVRDLLKEQATAEHRTLGEHLRYLASLADKQKRFERLRAEIDATPADDLASYRQETTWWESAQDA